MFQYIVRHYNPTVTLRNVHFSISFTDHYKQKLTLRNVHFNIKLSFFTHAFEIVPVCNKYQLINHIKSENDFEVNNLHQHYPHWSSK